MVILPVTGPIAWTWTDSRQVARISADARSTAIAMTFGYRTMTNLLKQKSGKVVADRFVVAEFTQATARAVIPEVAQALGRVPILVVAVPDGKNPGNASSIIERVVAGKVKPIALPGQNISVGILQQAVKAYAARAQSVTPPTPSRPAASLAATVTSSAGGQSPAAVTSKSPSATSSAGASTPVAASVANWSPVGSAWAATLTDGTPVSSVWDPSTKAYHADLVARILPRTEVCRIDGGIAVSYTYENRSSLPMQLCSMSLPELDLGPRLTVQDTRYVGGAVEMTASSPHWRGTYPGILYTPAVVVRNEQVAIGISVEYPVLDYKHDIRLRFRGEAEGRWIFELGMENSTAHCGFSYLRNAPLLMPGESRSYRVNIVAARPDQWISTLSPYREYFSGRYGGPRYSRDGRPIAGLALSSLERQSAENPNGWQPGIDEREGFASAARIIEDRFVNSSRRVMLWAPTGYSANQLANYPFQFASRWTVPINGQPNPMSDAPALLRDMASSPGRTLGLWWGHSANPSKNWADDPVRALRVGDKEGCELWFRELQQAVDAGAREIGLDAFVHHITPVWEQRQLLAEAQSRHPGVRFCIEERTCDIMHTMAATWVDGYRIEQIFGLPVPVVTERFVVADYLVSGHETWVGMQFNRSRDHTLWGTTSTLAAQRIAVEKVAGLGYVPVNWVPMSMEPQSVQ